MPNERFFTEAPSGRFYPRTILYLNIRPVPEAVLNGILFVVGQKELADFDRREAIYDRVDILSQLERVRVEDGPAYVYVGRQEFRIKPPTTPQLAAVRATYLQILEDGLAANGPEFRAEYHASSESVPEWLVIEDKT